MNTPLVALSPHLDDAILSCGGLIVKLCKAGVELSVVTLFAGSPPTNHSRTVSAIRPSTEAREPARVLATRRWEDEQACRLLGAKFHHGPFLDAVYRIDSVGAPLYSSRRKLFGTVHSADQVRILVEQWVHRLVAGQDVGLVLAPLAMGFHVDHQITRDIALSLAAQGYKVFFYEDFPYNLSRLDSAAAWERFADKHKEMHLVRLDQEILEQKIAAIDCYQSQIPLLFGTTTRLVEQVKLCALQSGGERLWHFSPAHSRELTYPTLPLDL